MSRPQQTIVTYDSDGKVTTIEHRVILTGTVDFGEGPKSIEEPRLDAVYGDQISAATVVATKTLLDAFEIDLAAERQRMAITAQAEADQAAALASLAQAEADKRQIDADE